jgi:hypothetical protein
MRCAGTCTSSAATCPPRRRRTPRPPVGPRTSPSATTWSARPPAREPLGLVPTADRLAERDAGRALAFNLTTLAAFTGLTAAVGLRANWWWLFAVILGILASVACSACRPTASPGKAPLMTV